MDAPVASDTFLFERFRLELGRGGLFRRADAGGWAAVALGARALDLLGLLVRRAGDLISKDELICEVWSGVSVEEANLSVQIANLRRVLDQGRVDGSCIQTVPGRGYRFVLTVTRESDARESPAEWVPVNAAPASSAHYLRRRPLIGMGVAALAAVLLAIGWRVGWPPRMRSAPPLVVVMPFKNLSGDPAEDRLAEAVTDDVTAHLARVPGMFLVRRQGAGRSLNSPGDVRETGPDLHVRYVVQGTVRRSGDTFLANAQLVSAETGAWLWADQFQEPAKELEAGQALIPHWLGQALDVALTDAESARSKRDHPTDPEALDLVTQARSLGLHPMGQRENADRIALYERALQLDPTSAMAMAGLAETFLRSDQSVDALERAGRLLAKARAIAPDAWPVLATTGYLLLFEGHYDEAISAYRRVLNEFPDSPFAYAQIAICLIDTGRAEHAIPLLETAIRLDPRSPFNWSRYDSLGFAFLLMGRDEDAIAWTRRALVANPNNAAWLRAQYHLRIAAAHARLGNLAEAHREVAGAGRIWPYDTVRSHWPETPSSAAYVAQIERFKAALRLAGDRDHADESADFGTTPDARLHPEIFGPTPTSAPGVVTILTPDLRRLLAERNPIIVDTMQFSWNRSIPGAVGLQLWGAGKSMTDAVQEHLRRTMRRLTKGDLSAPIVAVGWNAESFDGRNLALRLAALGYTHVYWYRGGREAWEVAELAETPVIKEDWSRN